MPIQRHPIEEFLTLCKDALLFDVRSPGEYEHAQLPGAVSLPLFTNEERALVGTAYKQVSREHAIKIGLDAFGPKMRNMVETVERAAKSRGLDSTAPVYLYCWRGGMRSGAVAWLLGLYGFDVHVLDGGYKAFRNWVLEQFTLAYPFRVLGGYTGSGKTELLHLLKAAGELVIDLEGLAGHKGSAFGNIGMPAQPSQELFENLLALQLDAARSRLTADGSRLWLEDESQRIGQRHIPHALWPQLLAAPISFVDIPFEARLRHIVEEYGVLDRERLRDAIGRISKRLGGLETKMALQHLDAGDLTACFAILLRYYDKLYLKGLHGRQDLEGRLQTISVTDVTPENVHAILSAL
ncbi:tRNA 2-selenouridine(34) synthase MnmH [Flaviaesturariibacter aridisoli]|uniref:tRNA 2-selenouridine(34) synthase MnmH n=1 Tax=Flaviaesturariibacter aridisoli TaxID=2545761 RepID=UPI0014054BB3|nr:tRNA 2-selenouridine(34) synthase MnmH [Flaviaesturariibacter aridisoli]